MSKLLRTIYNSKQLIIGGIFTSFVIWRFNKNFDEYSRAVAKEKVYDLRTATEQLKLYRELYDPDKDIMDKSSGPIKLLSVASEKDKEKMREVLNEYNALEDPEEIKKQIAKVKKQIEMLEERKTQHQGIKLSRVMSGYEPSEEALKKIREHYREGKEKKKEDSSN
jgi:hypothetical protein